MKINLSERLKPYTTKYKLPDKCKSCDSGYKYIANGSCGICAQHGHQLDKELSNNAEDLNYEYDEEFDLDRGCNRHHYNRERIDR